MPLDPTIYSRQVSATDVMDRNSLLRDKKQASKQDMVLRNMQMGNANLDNQLKQKELDSYGANKGLEAQRLDLEIKGKQFSNRKAELEAAGKEMEIIGSAISMAKDPVSYQQARQYIANNGLDVSKIPEQYDPNYVSQAQQWALSSKEKIDIAWQREKHGETKRHNKAMETKSGQQIKINTGGNKYMETRMGDEATSFQDLQKSATSAYNQNIELDRFVESSAKGDMGGAQPIITGTKNFLASFGFDFESLKDTADLQRAVGVILGNKMAELGARGLTDKDMEILERALPRVETSRGAREAVAGVLKKNNNQIIRDYDYAVKQEDQNYPNMKVSRPRWYYSEGTQNLFNEADAIINGQ